MNIMEEFMQGRLECQAEGCTEKATTSAQDSRRLYGQGPYAVDAAPIGPRRIICASHKQDSQTFGD